MTADSPENEKPGPAEMEPLPVRPMPPSTSLTLTPAQFASLADVPPEIEWLANITNEKTKRAYKADVAEFVAFAGLNSPAELCTVARAHVIAWRRVLEARALADATIRRKLSAVSSLFEYLCERNAIAGNPVDGVKRPLSNGNEGNTPALGDEQAKRLLEAPPPDTLKGLRDRAILAVLLYHGVRREELCKLRVGDVHSRQGVVHFRVEGKRDKIRFVPVHPTAQRLIAEYLEIGEARRGDGWGAFPTGEEQPHRDSRQASGTRLRLPKHRSQIRARDRY